MNASESVLCLAAAALLCGGDNLARAAIFQDHRLSDLPPPVRQTVTSVLGSGRLTEVVLTNENGHAVYELEMRQRGVDRTFTVAIDGSVLARQVFLNELPPEVLRTVKRETSAGKAQEIYWLNEEGDPSYYVEFQIGREHKSLNVAPDGWVTSRQVQLNDATAPVQAAIRDRLEGRIPKEIARAFAGDEVTFEVTDLAQGKDRLWIFNPDGSVAAEPVPLNAVPGPARATLKRESAEGRIVYVFKIPHNGSFLFEVSFVRREARHVCTVDADGRIISEELPLKELPEMLQKVIKVKTEGQFIVRIERLAGEGGVTYDITLRRQGKTAVLQLSSDGSLIENKSESP